MRSVRDLLRAGSYAGSTQNNLDYCVAWLDLEPGLREEAKLLVAVSADRAGYLASRDGPRSVESSKT